MPAFAAPAPFASRCRRILPCGVAGAREHVGANPRGPKHIVLPEAREKGALEGDSLTNGVRPLHGRGDVGDEHCPPALTR